MAPRRFGLLRDQVAPLRIEELILDPRRGATIGIVSHDMQQAARVSDVTAFFTMGGDRGGYVPGVGPTPTIFTNSSERLTEDQISGRFG